MSSDGSNTTYIINKVNYNFGYYYFKFIESPTQFTIDYSSPEGNIILKVTLKSINISNPQSRKNKIQYIYYSNYFLLEIQSFNFYTDEELEYYFNEISNFFYNLKQKKIKHLIIDLRGNSGGSPDAGNKLLSYILKEPFQYFSNSSKYYSEFKIETEINANAFKGNLYVIIDGGCFSTTGHVLSHLKERKRAVIVGEESGGSFICNDAKKCITLKYSGIRAYIPKYSFSTPVKNLPLGEGIKPDIKILYNIENILNNKDSEMDVILNNYINLK